MEKLDASDSAYEVANTILHEIAPDHPDITPDEYPIADGTDMYCFTAIHPMNATNPSSAFLGDAPNGSGDHYVMATLKTSPDPFDDICAIVITATEVMIDKAPAGRIEPQRVVRDACMFMAKQYYVPFLHEIDAMPEDARFADTYENGVTFEKKHNADWFEGSADVQMKTSFRSLPDKPKAGKSVRRVIDPVTGEYREKIN